LAGSTVAGSRSAAATSNGEVPLQSKFGGGSFGAQIGGESTDVIMLVMNHRGMEKLATDKFTIGGDASAAAGLRRT
jgi:SH3 domain-containing YSC84-like protein 1